MRALANLARTSTFRSFEQRAARREDHAAFISRIAISPKGLQQTARRLAPGQKASRFERVLLAVRSVACQSCGTMMTLRLSFAAWCAVAIAAGTALAACSSSSAHNNAGGTDAGGGRGGGGLGNSGGTSAGGSDAGGGGTPVTCLTTSNTICDQLSQCAPIVLKLSYGDLATCKANAAQNCAAAAIPNANGTNDPAACLAAIQASCDSYFETSSHPPTACRLKAGNVADQGACGYEAQCTTGEGCDLSQAAHPDPRCSQGKCTAFTAHASPCTASTDCDDRAGDQCVATFTSGPPSGSDGQNACQSVTYGGSGADCVDGTNKQCQAAFYCGPNSKCTALLGANATCDPVTNNHCDSRVGLSCQQVPQSAPATYACTAPVLVPSGAQCGLVNGISQGCYGNSYCDSTSVPTTCQPRVAQGQGCISALPNCASGLHCASASEPNPGTCQPPGAAVCQ